MKRKSRAVFLAGMAFTALAAVGMQTVHAAADAWTQPQEPFKLFGNAYYVGSHGLSSVLLTSSQGHVLIDGDVPESVPMIAESIRKLGFKITDVKYIVNSHTHFDHAGGIPGLQKLSGATVMASTWSAEALKTGGGAKDDPQYSPVRQFEPVAKVQVIEDNAVLKLGSIAMTAHYTPGHTPGGTTWTWQSCEGERCMNMVYADSLNAIGSNTYKFSDPIPRGYFERSFKVFENLRCDIIVSAHPEVSGLWDRLEKRQKGDANGLVDTGACKAYAKGARERWEQRLEKER